MMIANSCDIRNFLNLSYDEIEEKNLKMKREREEKREADYFKKTIIDYLTEETRIKAINVCFTDLEGKMLNLDYDRNFLLKSDVNLTFDGSSIRGFSSQSKSDLRLHIDWSSFRWLPGDIFGYGKVMVFANVYSQDNKPYNADFRNRLQSLAHNLYEKNEYSINIAPEIEGFLLKGIDVEQSFNSINGFDLATNGGYYNSLPQDELRRFIDTVAEVKRVVGFENEKDHPEVAPSQFELNYKYSDPIQSADQIQLYKLICRQVAKKMGYTACFLPKPIMNINGSGMHMNISISKNGKNMFYDQKEIISEFGKKFATSILYYAKDLCLTLNSSVNSYRRLDPQFEAPNEIKMSDTDRGSMIRIPLANQNSARVEVRSVAPDSNPYLIIYLLLQIGLLGANNDVSKFDSILSKREKLPSNIYDAIRYFKNSDIMRNIMCEDIHKKYSELKEIVANRCPKDLGKIIKTEEIIYHHEVTNQWIWSRF